MTDSGKKFAMPTSNDVAALAGVSQSTVSYVLSGKRPISDDTRRRVEDAMAQLTYQPNAGARALRARRTSVIALVVRLTENADVAGTFPYIETVIEDARARDYDVVLVTTDEGPAGLTRLAARSICDAIVLMDIRENDERVPTAASLRIPVVLIGRPADAQGLDAVDFDSRRAGELAVNELAGTGHHHVVLLGESPDVSQEEFAFIRDFEEGARSESERSGIDFRVVRPPASGWAGIERVAEELLREKDDRLGLLARTPQAVGWLQQLMLVQRLDLGRDISLVGLCTDATAVGFSSPVTNISPEPKDLARYAMSTLFEILDGGESSNHLELIQPRAVTRRGTTVVYSEPY